MEKYYVNKNAQSNGDHEVHTYSCKRGAKEENRINLGFHKDCYGALKEAGQKYEQVDGCAYCCDECHIT